MRSLRGRSNAALRDVLRVVEQGAGSGHRALPRVAAHHTRARLGASSARATEADPCAHMPRRPHHHAEADAVTQTCHCSYAPKAVVRLDLISQKCRPVSHFCSPLS